ncbi:MAG TPA: M12 family metallo-peptidase [Steroidobacteraceae bacterium]|nr:M12 family metallo-peptidase [Steroidobacteraceae bacterium]
MSKSKLCTRSAALACVALVGSAAAAPAYRVLYHERLAIPPLTDANGQRHLSFDAYGRHFDVDLEINAGIAQAVSAGRSDIKPYSGTLTGIDGSWVRLTQTRDGWRGVISDGSQLYAIETPGDLEGAMLSTAADAVSKSSAVMYRLADADIPSGGGLCGTDPDESLTSGSGRPTAQKAFTQIAADISSSDTTSVSVTRQLNVGVVADHQFVDAIGSDPEGAVVARMDIVDGIWSSQVGIHIAVSSITLLTDATDSFSGTTTPTDLLAEVAGYRAGLSAHDETGLTHLMTGRQMQGNIIGIAYLGDVCNGSTSVSLSQSTGSTTLSALTAAHELGHNFNSIHDGVPGVCQSTPQTYLMAPFIDFNEQFSACSLQQINLRAASASCLVQVNKSGTGSTTQPATSEASSGQTGGGGRLDLTWLLLLGTALGVRRIHDRRAA